MGKGHVNTTDKGNGKTGPKGKVKGDDYTMDKGVGKGLDNTMDKGNGKTGPKGKVKGDDYTMDKGVGKGLDNTMDKGNGKTGPKGKVKGDDPTMDKGMGKTGPKGKVKGDDYTMDKGTGKGLDNTMDKGNGKTGPKGKVKGDDYTMDKGAGKGHDNTTDKGNGKTGPKGKVKGDVYTMDKGMGKGDDNTMDKGMGKTGHKGKVKGCKGKVKGDDGSTMDKGMGKGDDSMGQGDGSTVDKGMGKGHDNTMEKGKTGPKGKVKGDSDNTVDKGFGKSTGHKVTFDSSVDKGKGNKGDYTMDKGTYKGMGSAAKMKDVGLGWASGIRFDLIEGTHFFGVKTATAMWFNTLFLGVFYMCCDLPLLCQENDSEPPLLVCGHGAMTENDMSKPNLQILKDHEERVSKWIDSANPYMFSAAITDAYNHPGFEKFNTELFTPTEDHKFGKESKDLIQLEVWLKKREITEVKSMSSPAPTMTSPPSTATPQGAMTGGNQGPTAENIEKNKYWKQFTRKNGNEDLSVASTTSGTPSPTSDAPTPSPTEGQDSSTGVTPECKRKLDLQGRSYFSLTWAAGW